MGTQSNHVFCVCETVGLMINIISDRNGRQDKGWNLVRTMFSLTFLLNQTDITSTLTYQTGAYEELCEGNGQGRQRVYFPSAEVSSDNLGKA